VEKLVEWSVTKLQRKKKYIKINAGKKKYKNKREFKGAAGCVCGRVSQLG